MIHYGARVNGIYVICQTYVAFVPEKIGGQVPGRFVKKEFSNCINVS